MIIFVDIVLFNLLSFSTRCVYQLVMDHKISFTKIDLIVLPVVSTFIYLLGKIQIENFGLIHKGGLFGG